MTQDKVEQLLDRYRCQGQHTSYAAATGYARTRANANRYLYDVESDTYAILKIDSYRLMYAVFASQDAIRALHHHPNVFELIGYATRIKG